ncbi:MAG: hypothetical protein AAGA18_13895, partial [Verrucomicrobiota bacterium]
PALQHYKHYYVVDRQSKPLMTDDSILKEHGALPDISPEYIKPETTTDFHGKQARILKLK